jgi:hypothetical protein
VLGIFGTDPLIGGGPREPPVDMAPSPYGPRASIEIRAEVAAPRRPTNGSEKAMPRRNYLKRILLLGRGWDEWDRRSEPAAKPQPAAKRSTTRRFGTVLSFCALFFAGLALSAGAGNGVRALLDDGSPQGVGATGATGPTGATGASGPAPLVQAQKLARVQVKSAQGLSVRPSATPSAGRTVQPISAHRFGTKPAATRHARPVKAAKTPAHHGTKAHSPAKKQPLDAEADQPGATVWLYRAAPDPTPPAARLRIAFARELVADSRQAHVEWALALAVLRAGGHNGRVPATPTETRALTVRLSALGGSKNGWAAALSYSSDTSFADHVVALRHYYRAVGMASLVYGLLSQKHDLEDRVLTDKRLLIYPGGRNDVAAHKVDVRVLATMLYLADSFHQVTVSCLISGHRLYARPGVVSAHIYGRAVDVAALNGISIFGHQQPGGITEQGVRALLMLPGGMLPAQIISLLGLGGPSFPLANHYNHIHVGF